jgi:hypothetical protein
LVFLRRNADIADINWEIRTVSGNSGNSGNSGSVSIRFRVLKTES